MALQVDQYNAHCHFALPQNTNSASNTDTMSAEDQEKIKQALKNLSVRNLIAIVMSIAAGTLLLPTFRIGAAVGALSGTSAVAIFKLMTYLKIIPPSLKKNPYALDLLRMSFLRSCVACPAIEEIIRGTIQTVIAFSAYRICVLFTTTIHASFYSACISIVVAGVLFGATHALNSHEHNRLQAIFACIMGNVNGYLQYRFGIIAAIAAHIVNNTIALSEVCFYRQRNIKEIETQLANSTPIS